MVSVDASGRRRDSMGRFLPEFGLTDKSVSADLHVSTRWYRAKVEGLARKTNDFVEDVKGLGRFTTSIRVVVWKNDAPKKIRDMKAVNREVARATRSHAKDTLKRSKAIVPVRTGLLKSTGRVHRAIIRPNDVIVTLSYDTHYAIYVHEMIELRHKPGKMAKFLSMPVSTGNRQFQMEIKKVMRQFVAERSV